MICPTIANCDTCDSTTTTKCTACSAGYYLDNTNACIKCSTITGFAECQSSTMCTVAADRYYLVRDIAGKSTGAVAACADGCATCANGKTCLTCVTTHVKMGGGCIFNNFLTATATLTPGAGSSWYKSTDTNNTQLGLGLAYSQQILNFIANKAGVDKSKCRFKSIVFGSIKPTVVVELAQGVDGNTALNALKTYKSSTTDEFGVAAVSGTANIANTSDDGPNLGLILGLTIPLVILGIFLLIQPSSSLSSSRCTRAKKPMERKFQTPPKKSLINDMISNIHSTIPIIL